MSTGDFEFVRNELLKRLETEKCSQRELVRRLGQPPAFQALLSKMIRGEDVSVAALRRILRALGFLPQPRRLHRVVMTPAQFAAWHALSPQERNERLGV